jgi:hypothetical protein
LAVLIHKYFVKVSAMLCLDGGEAFEKTNTVFESFG